MTRHWCIPNLLLGFGVTKLTLGGIVLFSSARTHLMTLVRAAAPSPWPKFGLTYNEGCQKA